MAVQSPPFALQNSSAHGAALFRQAASANVLSIGVLGGLELAVTAQSTPNMSVQVAGGRAWIAGTQVSAVSGQTFSTQACYFALNDAPVTVTIAAADPTNPRIDVVYIAVQDSYYSGSNNASIIGVVTGTPNASPQVPALPSNAYALAQVAVAANTTSITSGNITDKRAGSITTPQAYACTSSTRPSGVWTGFQIFETDTGATRLWNGTAWRQAGAAVIPTVASRRTAATAGAGERIIALDVPGTPVLVSNGSAWFQQGLQPSGYASPPTNAYVWRQAGTVVITTNSGGSFAIALPTAFSAPPLMVTLNGGDNVSAEGVMQPVGSNHTASTLQGFAANLSGGGIASATIRVNYVAIGYNT